MTLQEETTVASRTLVERRAADVPVHQDQDILAAAARLAGEDLCSIGDLSSSEMRAIMKLGHDVKLNPRDYRRALDAKQMVLMFEKASLRTRLSFEAGINTMGGNAIFSTRRIHRWVSVNRSPMLRGTWSGGWT